MAQNRWEIPELDLVVVADGPYIQVEQFRSVYLCSHNVILGVSRQSGWELAVNFTENGCGFEFSGYVNDGTDGVSVDGKSKLEEVQEQLVHVIKQAKFMARSFDKGR